MSKYYVTMIDNNRYWKLAGGYNTHQEALDMVDTAKKIAIEQEPKNHFRAFGTSLLDTSEPGILNKAGLI